MVESLFFVYLVALSLTRQNSPIMVRLLLLQEYKVNNSSSSSLLQPCVKDRVLSTGGACFQLGTYISRDRIGNF